MNRHAAFNWNQPGKASVLVDGQFGSTGKGLTAAYLAMHNPAFHIATTNAAAQAGHTTKFADGRAFVCFHLPTTGVINKDSTTAESLRPISYINAGAIIDVESLLAEIEATVMQGASIAIHPRAAIITDECKTAERHDMSSTTRLASTQKGVGAALATKVLRGGVLAADVPELKGFIAQFDLNDALSRKMSVVVEVPQGTGLSINHGYCYPYVTSRDCHVGAGLSDAGIHPSFLGPVCMVVRTMPIRVGNLYNAKGDVVGVSGPFYHDSTELDWEKDLPGVEPERTTVTKRVRRIATWSDTQYFQALSLNRPTICMVNFVNYLAGPQEFLRHVERMRAVESSVGLTVDHLYGFGPCVEDVTHDFGKALSWFQHRKFQ